MTVHQLMLIMVDFPLQIIIMTKLKIFQHDSKPPRTKKHLVKNCTV